MGAGIFRGWKGGGKGVPGSQYLGILDIWGPEILGYARIPWYIYP